MTTEGTEYEEPARCDKAEAIRKKYCLENNRVYEVLDNSDTFRELQDGNGDHYSCFSSVELDTVSHNGKLYFIKRIKN
jgi:hypothetical protein